MTANPADTGGKGTQAVSEERARQVARWIVDGVQRAEMIDRGRDLWGLTPSTVDRLIRAGRALLREAWELERPDLVAVLLSRSDEIYAAAMARGELNAALGAVNSLARLAQL